VTPQQSESLTQYSTPLGTQPPEAQKCRFWRGSWFAQKPGLTMQGRSQQTPLQTSSSGLFGQQNSVMKPPATRQPYRMLPLEQRGLTQVPARQPAWLLPSQIWQGPPPVPHWYLVSPG